MTKKTTYKIIFMQLGEIYEVFAKQIYQSDMYGFIEVEDFIFGEKAQMIVDPAEEKLKTEFADVKRSYIPMQAIIRIDEVDKEGCSKVSSVPPADSNVTSLPFAGLNPGQKGGEE